MINLELNAKKSLGQNFLQDENIAQKIADSIEVSKNDMIIEIGPGKGALTKYLVKKNCQFLAYEIDERMKSLLTKYSNNIIYCDFLKRDLKVDLSNLNYDKLCVIANIPYYITTPIIEHLIDSKLPFQELVLLVQKEVADRFSAKPKSKNYGYFTVYLNYYFEVSNLFDVDRSCFFPIPNVDSAVVSFKAKKKTALDQEKYFIFLKNCFRSKRKTLKNNLSKREWMYIVPYLKELGYLENVRAEEISSEDFEKIFLHFSS